MHIAILMANTDDSAFAARHPQDGEKFQALLAPLRPDWRFSVFAVKDGAFPPDLAVFDGYIITGSPASVHDSAPWVARLLELIRQIVAQGQPLFGACFGHQAIALALGGTVGRNPGGWVLGLAETVTHRPAAWMGGDAGPIRLYAAHLEQVLQLPEGARVIGGSAECPIGSFAIGTAVFTTQYHPEITADFIAELVQELEGKLPQAVTHRAKVSLTASAETRRIAVWIVAFFAANSARPPM